MMAGGNGCENWLKSSFCLIKPCVNHIEKLKPYFNIGQI